MFRRLVRAIVTKLIRYSCEDRPHTVLFLRVNREVFLHHTDGLGILHVAGPMTADEIRAYAVQLADLANNAEACPYE